MEEVMQLQGLIIFGKDPPSKKDYIIRYVSIPFSKERISFIPPISSSRGHILFDSPICRTNLQESQYLTNSFFDYTEHGRLFGDLEDLDGSYVSREFIRKFEDRGILKKDSSVKLKLSPTKRKELLIKSISFDLSFLGEGEINSFFEHVGYIDSL